MRKPIPSGQRMRILHENNCRCAYCGDQAVVVDHIIPYSYNPQNRDNNLVAACEICNLIASNKVFDGFIAKQSYILGERRKSKWRQRIAQQINVPMPIQKSPILKPKIVKPKKASVTYEMPVIRNKVDDTPQEKWDRIRKAIEEIAGIL